MGSFFEVDHRYNKKVIGYYHGFGSHTNMCTYVDMCGHVIYAVCHIEKKCGKWSLFYKKYFVVRKLIHDHCKKNIKITLLPHKNI